MAKHQGIAVWLAGFVLCLWMVLVPQQAVAQGGKAPEGSEPPSLVELLQDRGQRLTPEQIDAILALLDDQQARQLLHDALGRLSETRAAAEAPPPLLTRLRQNLKAALASAGQLGSLSRAAIARDAAAGYESGPLVVGLSVALLVAFALLVGGLVRVALARQEHRLAGYLVAAEGETVAGRLERAAVTLVADAVGIGAVCLALLLGFLLLAPENPRAGRLIGDLLLVLSLALGLMALGRFVLAPKRQDRRWLPLSGENAAATARALLWLLAVALVLVLPILYARFLDLPLEARTLTRLVFSAGVTLCAVVLVWWHRRRLVGLFVDPARFGSYGALIAAAVTLYLALVWCLWSATQLLREGELTAGSLLSMALVFAVPLLARTLSGWMPAALGERRGLAATVWVVAVGLGLVVLMKIWGIDFSTGSPFVAALFQAGTTLLLGLVGWLFIRGWLDRKIAEALPQAGVASGDEGGGGGAGRLATILPLMRVFALAVIATFVILSVLSAIGVNIAPLLAGAGVVGLAIGFGAQALVADIVSGIFFLLDDAFRVGEYIEVGNTRGTVESISLRSLRLRHHMGAVHTLPFGQIHSLTNYSRDWVIVRMEFRIDPETDLTKLRKLVKGIGAELQEDERFAEALIEPLKSQGVRRVEEDAVIIGVKFKARPGTQFTIRKEAYQRLLAAFRDNDIELVAKGVTVRVDAGEGAEAEATKRAAAAASRVLAEEDQGGGAGDER